MRVIVTKQYILYNFVYILLCSSAGNAQTVTTTRKPPSDEAVSHDVGAVSHKLRGRKLVIGTIESEPYVRLVRGASGRRELRGFIPDLVNVLSKHLGFEYELRLVVPPVHGYYDNETDSWTGLIGEVIKRETSNFSSGVDMAAAAISITAARQQVVSFVKPFMRNSLTVVIQRPDNKPQDDRTKFYFTIVQAFDVSVWMTVIVATVVVGLLFWMINVYNPYEFGCRSAYELASKEEAASFNLKGSLWFALTTLLHQGFERAPRSISAKFLGCVWFAFVTIFLTTFIAGILNNLLWASMDTTPRTRPSNLNPLDLGHLISSVNNPYKCGTVVNSQTYDYIQRVAAGEEFDAIRSSWQTLEGRDLLVNNVTSGLEKVRSEKYAFIMESTVANYYINNRPCDLIRVGNNFGTRSYGLAVPKNSPYLEEFHSGILQLEEEGDLDELQKRWFENQGSCLNSTTQRSGDDTMNHEALSRLIADRPRRVDTSMFSAPLALVVLGVSGSCVIAVAEMLYYSYRGRYFGHVGRRQPTQRMRLESDHSTVE